MDMGACICPLALISTNKLLYPSRVFLHTPFTQPQQTRHMKAKNVDFMQCRFYIHVCCVYLLTYKKETDDTQDP